MTRTRIIERDQILDAAEDVICENGAQALTLDLVAARAGISKGGLTYTFASKDALLSALLQRQVDRFRGLQQEYKRNNQDVTYPELRCLLEYSRSGKASARRKVAPIAAALAHSPVSLDMNRVLFKKLLAKLPMDSAGGRRARAVFMALMGMYFLEGLGLVTLGSRARNSILDDLLQALTSGSIG